MPSNDDSVRSWIFDRPISEARADECAQRFIAELSPENVSRETRAIDFVILDGLRTLHEVADEHE